MNNNEILLTYNDGMYDYLGLIEALLTNGYTIEIKKHGEFLTVKYSYRAGYPNFE